MVSEHFTLVVAYEQHAQHAAPPHTKLHNHVRSALMAPCSAQLDEALSTIRKVGSSIADCLALDGVAGENVNQVDL